MIMPFKPSRNRIDFKNHPIFAVKTIDLGMAPELIKCFAFSLKSLKLAVLDRASSAVFIHRGKRLGRAEFKIQNDSIRDGKIDLRQLDLRRPAPRGRRQHEERDQYHFYHGPQ